MTKKSVYQNMLSRDGKISIKLQKDAQKQVIEWCKIADNTPLIQGNLYNIGFFDRQNTSDENSINWDLIVQDLDFLDSCITILQEAGCHHWRTSDTDSEYYPIVIHNSNDLTLDRNLFTALGIDVELQVNSFPYNDEESSVPLVIDYDLFDDEEDCIADELAADELADISEAKLHLTAYQQINELMNDYLGSYRDLAILAGYDSFPIFRLGRSPISQLWIGFVTVSSNRDIY